MGMEIKIGQQWKEVDPRFERVVEVVEIAPTGVRPVKIKTVGSSNANAIGRTTWADAGRFNGKRGGYALITKEPT
jgi:hypothetical protein